MKKLLLLFICLQSVFLFGQNNAFKWAQNMRGTNTDEGNAIAVDKNGNVYTTGYFQGTVNFSYGSGTFNLTSAGGRDIFIHKFDPAGNFVWAKRIGGSEVYDVGNDIAVDTSGNVYVTGEFRGNVDFDPGPNSFNLTSSSSMPSAFILKLDTNGEFVWAKKISGTSSVQGKSIAVFGNQILVAGDFYGTTNAGIFYTSNGQQDFFVAKLNSSGTFLWSRSYGGTDYEQVEAVAFDPSGNALVTGAFGGTVNFGGGNLNLSYVSATRNGFVLKLTSSGLFSWVTRISSGGTSHGTGIGTDAQGNVFACGDFSDIVEIGAFSFQTEGYAINRSWTTVYNCKLSPSGSVLWAEKVSASRNSYDLDVDINGNVYTSTYTAIQKRDNWGNEVWTTTISPVRFHGIAVDTYNNVLTTGSFIETVDFKPGTGVHNLTVGGTGSQPDIFVLKLGNTCIPASSTLTESACGSYTFKGQTYTATGSYTQTIVNSLGCDSVVTLNLTINQPTTHTITAAACGSYTLNGQTYTSSGTYTQTLTNAKNCDSTITLNLTINQPTTKVITTTACGSYTLNGQTYASSGTYTQTLTNANNCDSTITLNLTINQPTTKVITTTACGSYTLNGQTYASSGTYTQTLTNANNCDSMITLNLTINQPTTKVITATSCGSYTLNGQTYASSGTYTQTLMNTKNCDSTITLNLTINQPTTKVITTTACGSYTLNGQTYASSGTYTQTLINAKNCDSTITLNLTINQPTTKAITATACGSYTLNGQTYASSGTYTQTLMNTKNCDSTITLNLTINQPTMKVITATVCGSYTLNGQTYVSSGTYTQLLTNIAGCDSTITLNLVVNNVDNAVSVSGATLTAAQTGATYQWLNCGDGTAVSGATSRSFTPTVNGSYAVQVTHNGCTKTSDCITITTLSVEGAKNNLIAVYPNPVNEYITVVTPGTALEITVFDETGRELIRQQANETTTTINVGSLAAGVYYIHVGNNFTEKLIKQ